MTYKWKRRLVHWAATLWPTLAGFIASWLTGPVFWGFLITAAVVGLSLLGNVVALYSDLCDENETATLMCHKCGTVLPGRWKHAS